MKKRLRAISRGRKVAMFLMNHKGPLVLVDHEVEAIIGKNLNHAAPDVARTTLALLPKGSQMSRTPDGVWKYNPPPELRPR